MASRLGASGVAPNREPVRRSGPDESRVRMFDADQPCAIRCIARPLIIAVENEEPLQSAQPVVFCSLVGKVGEI